MDQYNPFRDPKQDPLIDVVRRVLAGEKPDPSELESESEEVQVEEGKDKFVFGSERSRFDDGHRPKIIRNGKVSYLSQHSFKNKQDAIRHAKDYHQHVNVKGLDSGTMKWPEKHKLASEEVQVEEVEDLDEFQLPRQMKNKKKEMMVVKKGKVIVIDKDKWKEYEKKGYKLAEEVENLDEKLIIVKDPKSGKRMTINHKEHGFYRDKGWVREEVEDLEELSRKTLARYTKKASANRLANEGCYEAGKKLGDEKKKKKDKKVDTTPTIDDKITQTEE